MSAKKPIVLTIMDGWGHNPSPLNNAVAMARTPNFDRLWAAYPHTLLRTDGPFVGLPDGQMGNSEVGHLNIGAGRIVQMDITRIDEAIASAAIFDNPVLQQAMARARSRSLHLLGLVSDGGVHAQLSHLFALLEMAKRESVANVYVHCFTDGRDTPPASGAGFIERLQARMTALGVGKIASVSGRYYAMDRDNRLQRVEKAYRAIVLGEGARAADPAAAVRASYAAGITDEFIEPVVIVDSDGRPAGAVRDGDAVVFFNFRARPRAPDDAGAQRPGNPSARQSRKAAKPALRHHDRVRQELRVPIVLPPEFPDRTLGEICAGEGLLNLRAAETEKYPHVTYFFNGGREKPYDGEEREMAPSPKVATYDLQPEMSAAEVCGIVVRGSRAEHSI